MAEMGGKRTLTRVLQSDRMLRPSLDDMRNRDLVGPALMVSPILLTPIYLHVADLWPLWSGVTDIVAGATIIAVGVAGVCLLPIPGIWRATVSAGYAVLAAGLLILWAISFRGGL